MKLKKHFELNKNENTIYQNLRDEGRSVLRWKCIVLNALIRTDIKLIIGFYLRKQEKEKNIKSEASRRNSL